MALTRDEFLNRLLDSRVLPEADGSKLAAQMPESLTSGEAVARHLVKQGHLTTFQAQQIFAGRGQSLVLGNYVITDKLGQGGMGMVLKAEHRVMKRVVALKVLSPALVKTSELRQRFQREVRAVARLSHHNIVTAFDADEAGGVHYLVMEFVAGRDLASLVKDRGPLAAAQALPLIRQVAEGLQYAHEQGIVHRDIKPANLLLAADGTVKILDMGLARFSDSNSNDAAQADLTGTGAVMGTVDYMSPEQALNTKHADERADIYSLGCTLHFLLTGRPIFPGETLMEKIVAHREAPIPRIAAPAGVDQGADSVNWNDLNALFARMVAKQPDRRFTSMNEVISALKAVASGVPVMAGVGLLGEDRPLSRPADSPETRFPDLAMSTAPSLNLPTAVEPSIASRVRSRQSPKQVNRVPLIAGGAGILLLLGTMPFLLPGGKSGQPSIDSSVPVAKVAVPQVDDPSAATWPLGPSDEAWQGIVSHPRAVIGLRRWQSETIAPRGSINFLAVAPVSNRFVVGSSDRRWRVYSWSKDGVDLEQIIPMDGGYGLYDAKWSPDGRWLAFRTDLADHISTFDTHERRFGPRFRARDGETNTGALGGWNPAGTLLAIGGSDDAGAGIFLWSWPDGKLVRKILGHDVPPAQLAWSHDGAYLASASGEARIWSVSGEAGPRLSGFWVEKMAWNPNRPWLGLRTIKNGESEWHEFILDASQGKLFERRGIQTAVPLLDWTSDGEELLVTGEGYVITAVAPNRETPRPLGLHTDNELVLLPRPGHAEVATAQNQTLRVFNDETSALAANLGASHVVLGGWSSDGAALVGITNGRSLIVFDAARQQPLASISSGPAEINEVVWNRKHELLHAVGFTGETRSLVSTWDETGQRPHATKTETIAPARISPLHDGRLLVEANSEFSIQDPARDFASSSVVIPGQSEAGVLGFFASPTSSKVLVHHSGKNDRGENVHLLSLGNLGEASFKALPIPPGVRPHACCWNTAGDRFAIVWQNFQSGAHSVEVWEPTKPATLVSRMEHIHYVRFSPDDQQMLLGHHADFALARAFDADVRFRFQVYPVYNFPTHSQPWSPDGQFTALIGHRGQLGTVELVDPRSGYARQALPLHVGVDTAWNPRTGILVASGYGGLLRCWRAGAKESHPRWTAVQLSPEEFATFSPGGDLLHASTNAARQFVVMTESDDGVLTHEPLNTFRARISSSP